MPWLLQNERDQTAGVLTIQDSVANYYHVIIIILRRLVTRLAQHGSPKNVLNQTISFNPKMPSLFKKRSLFVTGFD